MEHTNTALTESPLEAAAYIRVGGIVAFPTETVYGLGADIFREASIEMIFKAKRRPADNPLIAHVGHIGQIRDLASTIPESAAKFIESFFPGPLTIVLPKSRRVPLIASAGLETIGVRMPANELARDFLNACGVPVAAPSANLSGRPSPTTWEAVYDDLADRIDCILQGGKTEIGLESTVIDCSSGPPRVLRPGAISLEQLQEIVSETSLVEFSDLEASRSPGMKHKHYAPDAKVILVDSELRIAKVVDAGFIGLRRPDSEFRHLKICRSAEDYARSVFSFFRECDHLNIQTIYCESIAESGIGAALMDRLRRAAAR